MSDMRDALRKAGLVTDKQVKQVKHKDRVHKSQVGKTGLKEERSKREKEFQREQERKKMADRDREAERRARVEEQGGARAQAQTDPKMLISGGVVSGAMGGNRKYFFVVDGGRITFLELSSSGVQRLQSGTAAIAKSLGAVRGEFCLIDQEAAARVNGLDPSVIVYWNQGGENQR